MDSNEAVKQVVAGGLGIAVLSASTLRAELSSGELVVLDVRGFPLERKWYMAYPAGKQITPATKVFMEHLLESNLAHGSFNPKPESHAANTGNKKKKTV